MPGWRDVTPSAETEREARLGAKTPFSSPAFHIRGYLRFRVVHEQTTAPQAGGVRPVTVTSSVTSSVTNAFNESGHFV